MIATQPIQKKDIQTLYVSSAAFTRNSFIPSKYTCDGENINPPIEIDNIPEETKSIVLIVEDPDAPIRTWVHWIVWNIPFTKKIKENSQVGIEGTNDFGQVKYGGPCPLSGTHHYHFKVYALDSILYLSNNSNKHQLDKIMNRHIIAFGELIGLYTRSQK